MTADPQSFQESGEPKKRSKTWIWWVVLGGGLLFTCCCGGIATFVGIGWYFAQQGKEASNRVFHEALAGGDLGAAYERAAPEFKQMYAKDQLVRIGKDMPALLVRDNWTTTAYVKSISGGKSYVLVRFLLDQGTSTTEIRAYCVEDGQGKLQIVGISPWLDAAVPDNVKQSLANAGSSGSGGR